MYWIALDDVLEQHGIRVVLVNARHTKNVPGRKTDVLATSEGAWVCLSGDKDTVASSPQGLPVADEGAHLRTDARFVPAAA